MTIYFQKIFFLNTFRVVLRIKVFIDNKHFLTLIFAKKYFLAGILVGFSLSLKFRIFMKYTHPRDAAVAHFCRSSRSE